MSFYGGCKVGGVPAALCTGGDYECRWGLGGCISMLSADLVRGDCCAGRRKRESLGMMGVLLLEHYNPVIVCSGDQRQRGVSHLPRRHTNLLNDWDRKPTMSQICHRDSRSHTSSEHLSSDQQTWVPPRGGTWTFQLITHRCSLRSSLELLPDVVGK